MYQMHFLNKLRGISAVAVFTVDFPETIFMEREERRRFAMIKIALVIGLAFVIQFV